MIFFDFLYSIYEFIRVSFFFLNFIKNRPVAVVGNSKNLTDNKQGRRIDKFSNVIRFNSPKINGYKNYIGSKTTVHVINDNVFLKKKIRYKKINYRKIYKDNKTLFIIIISKHELNKIYRDNLEIIFPKKYFIIDKRINLFFRFLVYFTMQRLYVKKNFTSGLLILLLFFFSKIKFIAYGFDKKKNKKNYTYYDVSRLYNFENEHDLITENKILNYLKI
jgi:hypothetical protein